MVKIENISEHGFWLYYDEKEYFLPYVDFPWFKECKISDLIKVKADDKGNFYWKALDVDLNLDIIQHPEKYPLKSKM